MKVEKQPQPRGEVKKERGRPVQKRRAKAVFAAFAVLTAACGESSIKYRYEDAAVDASMEADAQQERQEERCLPNIVPPTVCDGVVSKRFTTEDSVLELDGGLTLVFNGVMAQGDKTVVSLQVLDNCGNVRAEADVEEGQETVVFPDVNSEFGLALRVVAAGPGTTYGTEWASVDVKTECGYTSEKVLVTANITEGEERGFVYEGQTYAVRVESVDVEQQRAEVVVERVMEERREEVARGNIAVCERVNGRGVVTPDCYVAFDNGKVQVRNEATGQNSVEGTRYAHLTVVVVRSE